MKLTFASQVDTNKLRVISAIEATIQQERGGLTFKAGF